jgi:hypothetical protein
MRSVRNSLGRILSTGLLKRSATVALFLFGISTLAFAQQNAPTSDIPRTMSYQGVLGSRDGSPIPDGDYAITIRLYSDKDGTKSIYKGTYQVPVVNGNFNVVIGSGESPLPAVDVLNTPLWIGITVNGKEELRPYTPITSSAYAFNIADGAVTAKKMGTDYLGSLYLDGEKITSRGTKLTLEGEGIAITFDPLRNVLLFKNNGGPLSGAANNGAPSTIGATTISGNLSVKGTINGNLTGNASSATVAKHSLTADQLSNSWASGTSVIAALTTNGGMLSNSTTGNAASSTLATNAIHALSSDHAADLLNTTTAGPSVALVLKTWGGLLTNGTTGNAGSVTNGIYSTGLYTNPSWIASLSASKITGTVANALRASGAGQADQIANTYLGGASVESALKAYAKPIGIDITGSATRATSASEATHAQSADRALAANEATHTQTSDRANEIINTFASGVSVATALKTWGGVLSNSITGNAGSVTNGLYSTGSYANPSWITSLSAAKLTGPVAKALFADRAGSALPSGPAAGDLIGNFPTPLVRAVQTSAGPSIISAINASTTLISPQRLAKDLDINGGQIENTAIGTRIQSTGAFTTTQLTLALGETITPVPGTVYKDNVTIAWGDVQSTAVIKAQFGNAVIAHPTIGVYTITLPNSPTAASVNVTSQSADPVLFSATRNGNVITVQSRNALSNFAPADADFYYIVVGRP